ncbi:MULTISPECIES: filamentous haemagglutinin family protein [Stenotrophomonas]|uniref:Transporter n=1 Tax=Stenotrophomonas maltophilia TaxID=40324 RepID=A0A2J0UC48_STEMA|nr:MULTISPECIES: filamentous haemagglutinin family protein [Stenotrophomonas]PJL29006.1 transporter [Stenotrophomonas maltophilia]HDS1146149.1 filamentous hemagglutinin family protein [Stenotrophomonas maltophilia]HDS1162060.1 filamentous hemagglutinin family protein [Stenotrophomonas maltophilia]
MSHPLTTAFRPSSPRRNHPMAWAVAVALGTAVAPASQAQQAFSPGWFADRGAAQGAAAQSGRMPNGVPIQFQLPAQQQDAARQKLQQSIDNLGTAAQAIALQQRLQEQARQARRDAGFVVADGLGKDGLKVDENPLTRGWINARQASQAQGSDGRVLVSIEQTADKAILNWETFNVGGNTTLNFVQNPDWAVLNRVNDPAARPSQILGQLKADGTVFVANRNGVVFGNNSQVNVRNLLAAAARISDTQFNEQGLYSVNASSDALTDAFGKVMVERGARIATHEPTTATRGGGYVLLAGRSVENAGQIDTRKGQAQLAAGDSFVIRRGVGTAQNTSSTTGGNEIAPRFVAGSTAGDVRNSGLIQAREGDVTLAGRTVQQAGVVVATSTLNQRGTVHLLTSAADRKSSVTLAEGSTTAILLEDDGKTTALDSQRQALLEQSTQQDAVRSTVAQGAFDNLSRLQDRRDQSRVEIVSGGTVEAQRGSLTLATGGQVVVDAQQRALLADGARLDVSGATGVNVAMESNQLEINVQGNELRDSPDNRDSGKLASTKVWVDRRGLVQLPAGTGGNEGERWYAAGGLLEVGGYLGNQGHSIGEWAAQGGTVQLAASEVISSSGSRINLSGGSLDVASGTIRQSWLRGNDGQLYLLDDAPADRGFAGLYRGYELEQARWGVTEAWRNPLIGAESRYENGYTVGRDAGRLLVSAPTAVLEGQVDTAVFNGSRQVRAPGSNSDGYTQSQTAVARGAQLWLGRFDGSGRNAVFDSQVRIGKPAAAAGSWSLQGALDESRRNTVWLDADQLSAQQWGRLDLATSRSITLDNALSLADGGQLNLVAGRVDINGSVRIASGTLTASNLLADATGRMQVVQANGRGVITLGAEAAVDLDGRWANQRLDEAAGSARPWIHGGRVQIESSHDVIIAAGSRIHVDGGGSVDLNGKVTGGKGGDIALLADSSQVSTDGSGRLALAGQLSGLGSSGAGTLQLATGGHVLLADSAGGEGSLWLSPTLLRSGFSRYDLNGHAGLDVAAATRLDVLAPSLRVREGAAGAASADEGLQAWTAPLYEARPATGEVTQRRGASVLLRSQRNTTGGDVRIGEGAVVQVDSGQSIELRGAGNLDVAGALIARGGSILLDDVRDRLQRYQMGGAPLTYRIGSGAVLDVSGDSHAERDASGRYQGLVHAGGSIGIGGTLDWESRDGLENRPPDAFVVIERGAVLDASGARETLTVQGKGDQAVASNGGTISLRSANGLYLDGTMKAAAGGAGAQGGTLGIAFGGGLYEPGASAGAAEIGPRAITLVQQDGAANPGGPAALQFGRAQLSAAQVQSGGFDHLSLFADLRAQGDVDLRLGQSVRLYGLSDAAMGMAEGSAAGTGLHIQAPYLRLAQARWFRETSNNPFVAPRAPRADAQGHAFTASTQLLEVRDTVDLSAFGNVNLASAGDLRLLAKVSGNSNFFDTQLLGSSSMDITAAQIYPVAGTKGRIAVSIYDVLGGRNDWTDANGILRIHASGAVPAVADSVFGTLALVAAKVEQGGVVRAPLGQLTLGGMGPQEAGSRIDLLPGSVTSSSAAGLSVPFGGTVDGQRWRVDGNDFTPGLIGMINSAAAAGINLVGNTIDIADGALLDLSGGGELTGAGFVSGRGGSVDVRRHALVEANPAYTFSASSNGVYAIVPTHGGQVAPLGLSDGSSDPAIGQRITVPEGVPGLAAGTYTLLPASYALQPGAFRVELGAQGTRQAGATATGTGSWRVSGQQAQGLGASASPLWTDLLLTPAEVVRRHSGYNETSYNQFVLDDANRRGVARGLQSVDAGTLQLNLGAGAGLAAESALRMQGATRFAAAAGSKGFGGTVSVVTSSGPLEILAVGQRAISSSGAALFADALTALQPSRLMVGVTLRPSDSLLGTLNVSAPGKGVLVRSGASLLAPEVLLGTGTGGAGIVVEQGATISSVGLGRPAYDATDGYLMKLDANVGLLAVSNGQTNLLSGGAGAQVAIDIGACQSGSCSGQTRLLSEGSINASTEGGFQLRDNVSYGTRRLGLSMTSINLGDATALQAAALQGALPQGLALNQQTLQQLLRGNTAAGTPALETLSLTARDSINVFGNVDLDTRNPATGNSSLRELVLGAPAIHGYGSAGDQARIFADTLVWDGTQALTTNFTDGTPQAPGAPMVDRLGHGLLEISTRSLILGRAPYTRPSSEVPANRQILGFDGVTLRASEQVQFAGQGGLDVYQARGAYQAGSGWQYSGGALDIQAPLLTGAAGGRLQVRTGGDLRISGAGHTASNDLLGAELDLKARNILIDSTLALASGRLQATATGNLTLGGNAVVDVAGRRVRMDDLDKYSWGGDVELTAEQGDVLAAAGSRIDVSALNNRGGRISVNALGERAGRVDLAGTLRGSASGRQAVGGSTVPYDSGELMLRAQHLGDFSALNRQLDEGGFFGTRSFQLKQGDLTVTDTVKARNVALSLDGGSLRVNGRIDASGEQVGSIRLSARDRLQVDALLDAHGTGLRVDSYGKIIDSTNRAQVELTSGEGEVVLGSGARVDLRSGTAVPAGAAPGQNDGVARGTFTLNVPRRGVDDAAVRAEAGVEVMGARDVLVNAFRRYTDAPLALTPDVNGQRPQQITQQWLDTVVDPHNQAWMNAALGNADLAARLAALGKVRLRPGVEIVGQVSSDNPRGSLTVRGDLDLSGYRYGPLADRSDPARRGFGESAAMVLRAAGDINIYGSINDGFAPPPASPDEAGWLLGETADTNTTRITPLGGDIVVPIDGVTLQARTRFPKGAVLNYAIPFAQTDLPAGTVLPAEMRLGGRLLLPAGMVLPSTVTVADGTVLAAGTLLQQPLQLVAGDRLGAGFRLASKATLAAQQWPAGAALPEAMELSGAIALAPGSLIPSMTAVKLADGKPVNLRPADASGSQGRNWALAPMLPEGTTSWDVLAVAGADTTAADPRLRRLGADGDVVLADSHYGTITTVHKTSEWVGDKVFSEQGSIDMWGDASRAGIPIKDAAAELGMSEEDLCSFGPYCEPAPRLVDKQGSLDWQGDESAVGTSAKEFAAIFGMTEAEFCASAGYCYGGGQLIEKTTYGAKTATPLWSVLRTGKGDLQLLAARDVRMMSGYGVYTAGAPTSLGNGRDAAFNPQRAAAPGQDNLLGPTRFDTRYDAALGAWQAWYPDQGGNLTISAGRDIRGDLWDAEGEVGFETPLGSFGEVAGYAAGAVGNWLWRQGNDASAAAKSSATSWWINFGAYTSRPSLTGPRMVGFVGFGTLGGGNLTLEAGGNAGATRNFGAMSSRARHSDGVVAVVGSTGRVDADGTLHLTGGGDLSMRLGGALNPNLAATTTSPAANTPNLPLTGTLVNLRGHVQVEAARIGGIATNESHYVAPYAGLRQEDPFRAQMGEAMGGPVLVLGDSVATLQARGDVVLAGVADAGRVPVANFNALALGDGRIAASSSWFSLWTANTAVNLIAAGGDLAPGQQTGTTRPVLANGELFAEQLPLLEGGDVRYWLYPSQLRMLAASGSIRLGRTTQVTGYDVLLAAPSANGAVEVLAMDSILGQPQGAQISSSGADVRLPSPFAPGYIAVAGNTEIGNASADGVTVDPQAQLPLFAFGPNALLGSGVRGAANAADRFYAVKGDIVGLRTGSQWLLANPTGTRSQLNWIDVAAPVRVKAGGDILVSSIGALNNSPTDITVVQAGRDVVRSTVRVAGPGNVEVSAGRQLRFEDAGSVTTTGGLIQGDTRPGASVSLTAGNQDIDFDALRARYLQPGNLADPALPLASQPGKVVKIYDKELKQWLLQRFGMSVDGADALIAFDALPSEQQRIFLRQVYYAELREGGREYNDAEGPRFGSYLRGREAIATLLPDRNGAGASLARTGDIVMYGGSGVRTQAGGNIELMAPGGQIVVGVQGVVPPSTAGLVTQGQGDIRLFSQDSVLLGLSRVMTTFGGDILAWSEQGDINAGRGSRTTLVYTPPRRVYDTWGNVVLSPQVPASGAGIATLNPIAEVPPGDVDLIAPLGTIDAGEAGIRVSGNINLAALQVLNAANIQVQGESKGLPVLATVNVNALASASAAANSASQAAQDVMRKSQDDARRNQPSVISVQILGFGSGTSSIAPPARGTTANSGYDADSAFQFPQASRDEGTQRR